MEQSIACWNDVSYSFSVILMSAEYTRLYTVHYCYAHTPAIMVRSAEEKDLAILKRFRNSLRRAKDITRIFNDSFTHLSQPRADHTKFRKFGHRPRNGFEFQLPHLLPEQRPGIASGSLHFQPRAPSCFSTETRNCFRIIDIVTFRPLFLQLRGLLL
jgi:hypothetical protein